MRFLAARIQEGRAELRLSVDDLSRLSGVPAELIWAIISPEHRPGPDVDPGTICRLARALNRPSDVFLAAARRDTTPQAPTSKSTSISVTSSRQTQHVPLTSRGSTRPNRAHLARASTTEGHPRAG
jgi:transcriptional regulator with XRE-family HTH domain